MHANRSCRAGAVVVLAGLGTAGIAAASPAHYPAPGGHLAAPALVQTLDVVLQPAGVPAWAAPPVDLPAARVAAGVGRLSAVVVPYRGGTGWCLGLAAANTAMSGWCTPASGTREAVEGGLVVPYPGRIWLLARATGAATHLVVSLANGRNVAVRLDHGVALTPLEPGKTPGDRPVWLAAIDRQGATIERRSLGVSTAGWRALSQLPAMPKPPTKAQLKKLLHQHHRQVPCVGTPSMPHGAVFLEVWSSRPSLLLSYFIPTNESPAGGRLYVKASRPVRVTLIDGDGTRRPIPLGASRCAYVKLSAPDRQAPFRLEARNAAGKLVGTDRPSSWPGSRPTARSGVASGHDPYSTASGTADLGNGAAERLRVRMLGGPSTFSVGPRSTTRPSCSTRLSSQRRSTSARLCEIST